jgi:hydroxymethylglutaryl-CoA synthase
MSVEAARRAIVRAGIDAVKIGAIYIGSESHPYSVKPSGTVVAEAIGATPAIHCADMEFACKAGSEAFQAGIGLVGSGMADYALAIGMDTAQGRPGDALEYTAGAGGAAYIVGPAEEALAVIQRTLSYVSDTTDFWRRPTTHYPSHAERFSGDPGYFGHVMPAAEQMMQLMETTPEDYDYVVIHQPNPKFPTRALEDLGFKPAQWKTGLLVPVEQEAQSPFEPRDPARFAAGHPRPHHPGHPAAHARHPGLHTGYTATHPRHAARHRAAGHTTRLRQR